MTQRKPPTPDQLECAERANKLWLKKKRKEKISQATAAEALGMSASGFNQYINGKVALNTDTIAAFAIYFKVNPMRIDPNWLGHIQATGKLKAGSPEKLRELLQSASPVDTTMHKGEVASPEVAAQLERIYKIVSGLKPEMLGKFEGLAEAILAMQDPPSQ